MKKRLYYLFVFILLGWSAGFAQLPYTKVLNLKSLNTNDYQGLLLDYNNDGKTDFLWYLYSTHVLKFYRNDGIEFVPDFDLSIPAYSNIIFHSYFGSLTDFYFNDIDLDGNKDLLIYSANHANCSSNSIRIYWGNSTTYFDGADYTNLAAIAPFCVGAVFVDFNNDGLSDVHIRSASGSCTMYKNNGGRNFIQVPTFNTGRDINQTFFDVDEDGYKDMVYTKSGWADGQWGFRFNKGLGNGNFNPNTQIYYSVERARDWDFVPINLDSENNQVMDFAFLCYNDGTNSNTLYKAKWDSVGLNFNFENELIGNSNLDQSLVSPVDYNNDGNDDLVMRYKANGSAPFLFTTIALINDGFGNFSSMDTLLKNSNYYPADVKFGDNNNLYLFSRKYNDQGNLLDSVFVLKMNIESLNLSFSQVVTDVLCHGNNTGSIEILPSGGTPDYEYSIDNGINFQTSNVFENLFAGDYEVIVKDANALADTATVTIAEPAAGLTFTENIVDVLCFGNNTGSIEILASGGTPDYDYSINNGANFQTTNLFENLFAGDYEVIVRDANDCADTAIVTITEPAAGLAFTENIVDVLCFGDATGSIEIIASGGTPAYEYSIDNGVNFQTSNLFENLLAGDYDLLVRDANDCADTATVTITEPAASLTFTENIVDVLCFGNATGSFEIIASGGTPAYEYSIDNGANFQTTNLFESLLAGDYEVIVRDANECADIATITITEPAAGLTFTENIVDVLCFGNATGSIEIIASGGTPAYEYSIDNGANFQTTNLFENLLAGDYEVIVRDANSCADTATVTIAEPAAGLTFTENIVDVLCFGNATGSIEILATGGTPDYDYSINNGANFQTTNLFENLLAGDYEVIVRDANDCSDTATVTIVEPAAGLSFTENIVDVLCFGNATGSIEIIATGGTPAYDYSIDNGANFQTTNLFENLLAGDYEVIVRDANDCADTATVTITEPAAGLTFTENIVDVLCFGDATGSIEIIATGGTPTYEYSIDNGTNFQTTNLFDNLLAGDYDVIVRDANYCSDTTTVTIAQPAAELSFATNITHVLCFGDTTGSIEITAVGGTPTYEYSIDNGTNFQTSNLIENLLAGDYDVIVRDANACTDTSIVAITQPAAELSFTETLTNILCFGDDSGIIEFLATGGTPTYEYSIDGGASYQTISVFSNLVAGDYDLVVRDFNNCLSQHVVTLTQPTSLPEVSFTGLETNYCLGDVPSLLSGNHAPEGVFSGPGVQDSGNGTATFTADLAGVGGPFNITYEYTDSDGCYNSQTQQTSVFSLPVVSFTGLDANYCDGDTEVLLTGSEAPNGTFTGEGVIDNGNGTAWFNPIAVGVGGPYAVTYTYENSNGCIGNNTQQTYVSPLPTVSFTGLNINYCQIGSPSLLNGNMAPEGSFSGPGITNNGNGTALFNPAAAGAGGPFAIIYTYTSTEGCLGQSAQETTVLSSVAADFSGLNSSLCTNDENPLLTGNLAPLGTFSGPGITDHGNGTATLDLTAAGVGGPYEIIYQYDNPNGCFTSVSKITQISESPHALFTGLDNSYCKNDPAHLLTGNYSNGVFTGPGTSQNANGTGNFSPIAAGVGGPYNIGYLVTLANGCSDEDIHTTQVYDIIPVSFTDLAESYCASDEPILLTGSEAPEGYFMGRGITDLGNGTANFNPAMADTSIIMISYHVDHPGGCNSIEQVEVTIMENPVADFTFTLNNCDDEAIFMDLSYSNNGSIVSWDWYFDDPYSGINNQSTLQNPVHHFITNKPSFGVELEVTDEQGCTSAIEKNVEPYSNVVISGNVSKTNGDPITQGYVAAFYLSDGVLSIFADLAVIQSNGDYEFTHMSSCVEYLIHAIPNHTQFPYVYPRWYEDAFYWTDATILTTSLGNDTLENIDFHLQEQLPIPNGSSSISGGVFYIDSKGEPVKNVDVILEYNDPTDKVAETVDFELTNESGLWSFSNLPVGDYRILIDIPGLRMDSVYHVEITQPDTHLTGFNYYVDTLSGIYIIFNGLDEAISSTIGDIELFPNPTNGTLSLMVTRTGGKVQIHEIEISDLEGRVLERLQENFNGTKYEQSFDFRKYPSGLYLIKIRNDEGFEIRKFVIQR